jgi:hypothetical protein
MIPELNDDEAIVIEDFLVAGWRMPPHSVLADILLRFQVQLHQLTPNVIAQLSKYFSAVGSFGGASSDDAFAKRYELHYQPKKIESDEGFLFAQYSCLNLHAKRDSGPKLSLAVKNKWSAGWMKAWFYCWVPYHRSSEGGKSVFALRSRMSALDYSMEPEVDCPNNDVNDSAFVRAMATIESHDVVEEFLACVMYPLASGFGFKDVAIGTTNMSKVETPLPNFPVEAISAEEANCFLVKVDIYAERILGSYEPKEYDVFVMAKLLNGGRLNRVFEHMGVPYAPCPLPGTEAFQVATRSQHSEGQHVTQTVDERASCV